MREPPILEPTDITRVWHRGRRLSYFAGSDYFRLSWHETVRSAVAEAARNAGINAAASRLTTGNLPIYCELEQALGRYFRGGTATLTSSGYAAPLVAAQALAAHHTHVLIDARAHACLVDAARLTGLPTRPFLHRDPASLATALRRCGRAARALVLTDGLFPPAGNPAPIRDLCDVVPPPHTLLVDDAHGVGVLGRRGRGTVEWSGVPLRRVVLTCTLSKALGAYGGVVLGPRSLRAAVLERSGLFTGNTVLPPPIAAGALAALTVLEREGPARRARLEANVQNARAAFSDAGLAVPAGPAPTFVVALPSERDNRRLEKALLDAGIYPSLIRYPNGPCDRFFRFAVSSEHTVAEVEALRRVLGGFFQASS